MVFCVGSGPCVQREGASCERTSVGLRAARRYRLHLRRCADGSWIFPRAFGSRAAVHRNGLAHCDRFSTHPRAGSRRQLLSRRAVRCGREICGAPGKFRHVGRADFSRARHSQFVRHGPNIGASGAHAGRFGEQRTPRGRHSTGDGRRTGRRLYPGDHRHTAERRSGIRRQKGPQAQRPY